MRNLTQEEIDLALDDNSESENGYIAIESNTVELALKETGTSCGHDGNHCFMAVGLLFPELSGRFVRGWYDPKDNTMGGMIHIQCTDEEEAELIERAAESSEGNLRVNGPSLWEGFYEFENE